MEVPTEWDLSNLKRIIWFLYYRPRLVQWFFSQKMPNDILVFTDGDHAGCPIA